MNKHFKMYQIRQCGFAVVGYTDSGSPLSVEYRRGGWYYDDVNPDTGEIETLPCSEAKAHKLLARAEAE